LELLISTININSFPLISFSLNYIIIGKDGIYKNDIYYSIYKKVYQDLVVLEFICFNKIVFNKTIDFNVRIKGFKIIKTLLHVRNPLIIIMFY